jgi:methionyl-tRNA formyltransferase
MKVFFAGTPDFAIPVLEAVAKTMPICGVLTAPDKPQGRGKMLEFPPVKEKAIELGLHLLQPAILDDQLIEDVKTLQPDILVVAAYGKIFKENFLSLFPMGGINLHPSLLPLYRGPAPIPAVILAGDSGNGVTVQRLALKMDSGDILSQAQFPLTGNETTESLTRMSSEQGAAMVVDVLGKIESGTITGITQDNSKATYCKLIKKENGLIDWKNTAINIERQVRAYNPWPKAHTSFDGKTLSITSACIFPGSSDQDAQPGYVLGVDKQCGILVKTGMGILGVKRLQIQ